MFLREAFDSYLVDASESEKSGFRDWREPQKSSLFRYHYFILKIKLLA